MKKAVVVGGSGFVGSHVADYLSNAGYNVVAYDKRPSKWIRQDQSMVIGDIDDIDKLEQTIVDAEVVYNFAALADLNQALDKPLTTVQVNIMGNLNVMEACRKNNVRRFIFASTIYVYSREGGFYRCSKQAAEHYVEEYQRVYELDYTILRFGSLYGPRAEETNGLYRIVRSALETGKICYKGNAESMREYIHVEDAAKASITAIGAEFCNQNVTLTGQEPMLVLDLMKVLAEILGLPKSSIEFIDDHCEGHYVRTPYAYQPKIGRKFIPPMHVDLGQGLLQLIDVVREEVFSDE
jgi:UDP-glucose 4-epimerase